MLGGLAAIARLAEKTPAATDHTVASNHPITRHAARLCRRQAQRNLRWLVQTKFQFLLIDLWLHGLIFHAGGIEHLASDRACRGKGQCQKNNLVEKERTIAS